MKYKFSPQQIVGINYFYAKIASGAFDEDHLRLLLIHLREFLRNRDNEGAADKENAALLREAGDSIAHTVRDKGLLHRRLVELVPQLARPNPNMREIPHPLFNLDEIVAALRGVLIDSGVLYSANGIDQIFERESLDLKICLISLLNGMVFRIDYPTIEKDFFFLSGTKKPFVNIRTEVDLHFVPSLHDLRLNAALPFGGGKFSACVLRCDLHDMDKIEPAAMVRTGSQDGYCEPIKALRQQGRLIISAIPTGASSVQMFDIRRLFAYDTNPIPQTVRREVIGIFPSGAPKRISAPESPNPGN